MPRYGTRLYHALLLRFATRTLREQPELADLVGAELLLALATMSQAKTADAPAFRYNAALAAEIETRWQQRWESDGTYEVANPSGLLADTSDCLDDELSALNGRTSSGDAVDSRKLFVMDMFPYPSGSGLHVGHPLGYISTDVYVRYKRMCGFNVLYTMGFDAFGLPAEEHARQTGQHPRINTEANIANMRRQLDRLGLAHDKRRGIATTDTDYYRWTQWIFLQIFNSWFDPDTRRARPISELIDELESGQRTPDGGTNWSDMDGASRRRLVDDHRLAYLADAPVNWCPALGTVLANEEVTAQGRSERGNHEVFKRPLKQWMMRITTYADRLLEDLDLLDWPESVKTMQRNWIGRSEGAYISFPVADRSRNAGSGSGSGSGGDESDVAIEVFTTRPDTIYGTTYMVLAPEHPLVDSLMPDVWPDGTPPMWTGGGATPGAAVEAYRARAAQMSDYDRSDSKTGVYLGAEVVVPTNGSPVPVFIADYVLMGYGTGAVMGVPGEDQRDLEFAETYGLDVIRTVQPPEDYPSNLAYSGEGPSINSGFLDGLDVAASKTRIIEWLEANGYGKATVTYRMRDWLFSRQRYWGEPIPIVFDDFGPVALPDEQLPLELPELTDWAPRSLARDSEPEPPLGRVSDWLEIEEDLGEGVRRYRRELNTMPQWAGSCWYYLRYLDPTNNEALADSSVERYWMSDPEPDGAGGVDLYVGGVEHAVLHLLYARFWHKVLFDLGHVCSPEPFKRLINQGYILAYAYRDERGVHVPAEDVTGNSSDGFLYNGKPVTRDLGKMGKSLRNAVTPDDMYDAYGADTLRLYEMFMGPINQDRPWETRSVVGSQRVLQRVWRNLIDEDTGALHVRDEPCDKRLLRLLHRTIDGVSADMEAMRFNTAIAKLTELNNEVTRRGVGAPREVADTMVRMLAPLVPHFAEELWHRLHGDAAGSVTGAQFPEPDPELLVQETIEVPVQVNGKVRGRVTIPAEADEATAVAAALAEPNVTFHVGGRELHLKMYVPGRIITLVA